MQELGLEVVSVTVCLPLGREDYVPEFEDLYKKKHSSRNLQWHHKMSNGKITFYNALGRFDIDVATFADGSTLCMESAPGR
jgi:hypothetical protein